MEILHSISVVSDQGSLAKHLCYWCSFSPRQALSSHPCQCLCFAKVFLSHRLQAGNERGLQHSLWYIFFLYRQRHDSDMSPARIKQEPDSDASPPRKAAKSDSDASPPRRLPNVKQVTISKNHIWTLQGLDWFTIFSSGRFIIFAIVNLLDGNSLIECSTIKSHPNIMNNDIGSLVRSVNLESNLWSLQSFQKTNEIHSGYFCENCDHNLLSQLSDL